MVIAVRCAFRDNFDINDHDIFPEPCYIEELETVVYEGKGFIVVDPFPDGAGVYVFHRSDLERAAKLLNVDIITLAVALAHADIYYFQLEDILDNVPDNYNIYKYVSHVRCIDTMLYEEGRSLCNEFIFYLYP